MNVFLTGGTGFIGRSLTRYLLDEGWTVTALARKPDSPQARLLSQMGARCVQGDVTDRASVQAGMAGADLVIHNAAHYEYGVDAAAKRTMREINVGGTEIVLGVAHELKIPRTVYVSSVLAYGESGPQPRDETFVRTVPYRTWYEQTKAEAHEIAKSFAQRGLPLIIVCPGAVIGPNDHSVWGYFQRLYINGMMPPMGWAPNTMFALINVEDVARGIVLAAQKGRIGEVYILAGEAKSMREHVGLWSKHPGGMKTSLWLPTAMMKWSFLSLEPLLRMAGLPAFMSWETAVAGSTHICYSAAKAQRELGWTYLNAEQMWNHAFAGERELLQKRADRSLLARLKPVDGV